MAQWSHSRLETWRSCPRKFFYRYVQRVKLPEEPESIAQFLGTRVHEGFERLYGDLRQGLTPTLDGVLAHVRERWAAEWHDAVTNLGELSPEQHRAQAEGWITDYWNRHAPFAGAKTVGIEQRVSFPLDDGGRHTWIGFIDRLARTSDGTWQIHDYKTNRRLPTQADKDADPQLAYYEIGIRRMWPADVRAVELTWHFVAFDTSITSTRSGEQLEALRAHAIETIEHIEAQPRREDAFPTHETRLCDWCEFQSVCPVRKHLFAVAKLPPNKYANEPGVKLVNRWAELDAARAELREQIAALEAEIEEVREALTHYADANDAEVIAGDEREATVKRSETPVFPRASYEDEAELAEAFETQLRASPQWGLVSSVDRHALARLWKQRETLDADLRALLEEFARLEEKVDVRLRRKKG